MAKSKPTRKCFPGAVREKVLLWCARHCCICGKQSGIDIELHHINPDLSPPALNEVDNTIPVCYDCHAKLELSRSGGPRGSKWTQREMLILIVMCIPEKRKR
jgi:5-methylcytosine-specific restriction endonuclease McrA